MRHCFSPPSVALLASGMGEAATAAGLIAPCGRPLGLAPRSACAARTAIAVAAVAVATEHHLTPTAGAEKQTG